MLHAWLILPLISAASSAEAPADVVQAIPSGSINWTEMRLVVSSRSDIKKGAWKDRRVQEQDALDSLPPRLHKAARAVQVTPESTAADLISDGGEAALAVEEGLTNWRVIETRYHATGGVEMDGGLDLEQLLRPAVAALATGAPTAPIVPGAPTGVVIDARGLPFVPCVAPSVLAADGRAVVRAQLLSEEAARFSTPVVFVSDPAASRAWKRAGDNPIFARASAGRECELTLEATSALAADPAAAPLIAAARVVIVVGAL